MAEVGTRAGYPQVTIPAGYDPTARRPQAISFTGTAGDDAKLLGFGYAFERAALVRRTPSEVMPQTWHCVAPIVYIPRTCGAGRARRRSIDDSVSVPLPVGGTVPATLSLTVARTGVLRRVHAGRRAGVHGVDDGQRDQHGAGRDADGVRSRPPDERDVRAARAARGRRCASRTWTAPVSNDPVTIGFRQRVKADRRAAHRLVREDADVHAVDDESVASIRTPTGIGRIGARALKRSGSGSRSQTSRSHVRPWHGPCPQRVTIFSADIVVAPCGHGVVDRARA